MELAAVDWISAITQAGFGALVWYMMAKFIPDQNAQHQHERGELVAYLQRRDEAMQQVTERYYESNAKVVDELRKLSGRSNAT